MSELVFSLTWLSFIWISQFRADLRGGLKMVVAEPITPGQVRCYACLVLYSCLLILSEWSEILACLVGLGSEFVVGLVG